MGNEKRKQILSLLNSVISYSKIAMFLFILWFIFSGQREPFMLFCGVLSVIITFVLCIVGNIISVNVYIVKIGFLKYVYTLLKNIILSTLQMIKIIYSKNIKINPGTTMFNVARLTNQEKVLFSNLITMTPGTFVIAVDGSNFLIHALNRDDLNFDNNIEMSKLLRKLR